MPRCFGLRRGTAFPTVKPVPDELGRANDQLLRANLDLRVMHTAFASLLNLADERPSEPPPRHA